MSYLQGKQDIVVKEKIYRNIFNYEFNLSFHHRIKYQCDVCSKFLQKQKADIATEEDTQEHEQNLRRKEQAREDKENDKKPKIAL